MIYFVLSLILIGFAIFGYYCYTIFVRLEKLSKNQAIMVEWCDTLRQNEEQLLKDIKQLHYEVTNGDKKNKH